MSHIVRRSAIVPFRADKMYGLVADVPRYPEFLKWCSKASAFETKEGEVTATLEISFKGLKKTFTTLNQMTPASSIEMSLVEGPFSRLHGIWLFTELGDEASKIELDIAFDFDNPVVAKVVGPLFSHIANHQVDAFEKRARELYG
ncbi:type II toxin-antitoxin system RatA family toxin [Pseudomonadota bacterium]